MNNCNGSYHQVTFEMPLPKVTGYNYLVVIISNYLRAMSNYKATADNNFRVLWAICRSFDYLNKEILGVLYPKSVRLYLSKR